MGSPSLTNDQRRERVEAVDKIVADKGISIKDACTELKLSTSQYYQSLKGLKGVKRKPTTTAPKNQMVQVVVNKREDVNIVIMKGNAETVKEIASSLSGIFGGE